MRPPHEPDTAEGTFEVNRQKQQRQYAQRRRATRDASEARVQRSADAARKRARRAVTVEHMNANRCAEPAEESPTVDEALCMWWDRLPEPESVRRIALQWNRTCNYCNISVLTGEATHAQCFACGPKGRFVFDRLPSYPEEWNVFLQDRRVGSLSRKLNACFTLAALGVQNGAFHHFNSGPSAVTLNGGRTYYRMLPAEEGSHPIKWFLYDALEQPQHIPSGVQDRARMHSVPPGWVAAALAGLRRVTQARFYRCRFFQNAAQMGVFSRLTGEWLVDAQSAVEESRLNYLRQNQHAAPHADEDQVEEDHAPAGDGDDQGDGDPTGTVRLPSSFVHSPAWMRANVADCLALRRAYGNVTFFTTYTCNPTWPEIKSQLRPGQSAADRPDVTIRVFKQRLSAVKRYMQKLFGPDVYRIAVTEFQKRCLPHCHELVTLRAVPHDPADIDKVLSAELPVAPGPLRDAVHNHMIHSHDRSREYHRCGWPDHCQYGFPKPLTEESYFDVNGSFVPRRRKEEDRWVVLHCPALLLSWDGHVNTEYGGTATLAVYLYKYFFKPAQQARYRIGATEESSEQVDEAQEYESGRWLSAMEAAWRLAGYHISTKNPGVRRLPVHLPGRQFGQMRRANDSQSNATALIRYLDRPSHPALDRLTYVEFGERCRVIPHDVRKPMHELDVLEEHRPGRPQMRIRLCGPSSRAVARLMMLYPHQGDVYYLRAILAHRSVSSFVDARTVDGTVHPTFQEAAYAMGLFTANNEGELAFKELIEFGVAPAQLRWLFCVLACEGMPVVSLWEKHEADLALDYCERALRNTGVVDEGMLRNEVLLDLQRTFASMGHSLQDYGLPQAVSAADLRAMEHQMFDGDPGDLHSFKDSLTEEQMLVYRRLCQVVFEGSGKPVYVDGRAGRGKTYTLYPVIGAVRKANGTALITASSAHAARNYPGGQTVHHMYKVPVREGEPFLESTVKAGSARADLLLDAAVHIIDEIGSLHFAAFDCADRLMRNLTGEDRPWGGKPLITLGDWRQAAPVVRFGGRKAICAASLRTQKVFEQFEVLTLDRSMRQRGDLDFSRWLDATGDDYANRVLDLARFAHTTSVEETLHFVFPEHVLADPHESVQRAILSPYNRNVEEFNARVLERLAGDRRVYYSTDWIEDGSAVLTEHDSPAATPEFLHALNDSGVPPHELQLKIGAVCRFTRNLDPANGVTKNTRCIVRGFNRHTVTVVTLPVSIGGRTRPARTLQVPRIDFVFQPPRTNFVVHRKQHPLMLCYAVTFNSCQGLTVLRLALDLREPVFSHGQLYCALTRVPNAGDVLILKRDDSTLTTNIVWRELLLT